MINRILEGAENKNKFNLTRIFISVIIGLGLASIFRKACKERDCIIIQGPSKEDTEKYFYKYNSECYKYNKIASDCEE